MRRKPLSEQVIVVLGASSGVGRATAREAGRSGAKVVVASRHEEALRNAAADVEGLGSDSHALPTESTSPEELARLCAAAVERFGRIDTFVATTMVTVYAEVERLAPEELARVLEVNFLGRAYAFWAALPHLRASRGTFVDVNSALAYRGIPLQAAYCASKAAARAFFEAARTELEREGAGVAISLVLPGAVNTPQFDRGRQKLGLQPAPVPPIYQPETTAAAVLHCAEQPVRELPVTWGAQKLLWGQKLSPRAGDLQLLRTGWESQTTGEPKPLDAPDNLWQTLPGDPGAHGRFDDRARGSSAWTALRLRRGKLGLAGLLGLGAGLATLGLRSRD
jgi:NAD(P)-dependent dehydrogenase (short-subunit alcohol dehydrogenase family)